ncbi:MAG: RsmE family RNA methyltransferase, partial [Desulfobulbaceae bacterium]|nr:RsmE family RNA methyltransferase [Desulfobulbaceae bacterium]
FDAFTRSRGPICLFIGPEGGFHPDEVDRAGRQGFQTVSLGHLTLRAETAALAALSIVQYLTGELQPITVPS